MHFFCPSCWNEIKDRTLVCPFCGSDLSKLDAASFDEKLLGALCHHEPETVKRAVYISGEKQITSAIEPMKNLLKNTSDPYLQEEIIKALCKYEDPLLIHLIKENSLPPVSIIVRKTAKDCLRKLKNIK